MVALFFLLDDKTMKKPSHIPIKISALIIFIASAFFSAHHAHAQEIEYHTNDLNEEENIIYNLYNEISLSLGQVSYADSDLWNNNRFYSVAFRKVTQSKDNDIGFFEFDFGETYPKTPSIDGLTRYSSYQKLGAGFIFNKSPAATTFFSEFGAGLFTIRHYVEGVAAWQSPESDEEYEAQIIYENAGPFLLNELGVYFHLAFGLKVKNAHKFSLYIQSLQEGALTARSNPKYKNPNSRDGAYYYGEIPDRIATTLIGVRYSLLLASPQKPIPPQRLASRLYVNEDAE